MGAMRSPEKPGGDASRITLTAGEWTCDVVPDLGGGLAGLRWGGDDVLRPAQTEARARAGVQSALGLALFPMVPWVNRLADGRLDWGERSRLFPASFTTEPHALHGLGWTRPWTVTRRRAAAVCLATDLGPDWPWRHHCAQTIALTRRGLWLALRLTNLDTAPMPASIGFHPFFAGQAGACVSFDAGSVWTVGPDRLPCGVVTPPPHWDFTTLRRLQGSGLDHCFADWTGAAVIAWPGLVIALESPDCRRLQIYAPSDADMFCLEPQTAIPNALAWSGPAGGAEMLGPGESLRARMRIRGLSRGPAAPPSTPAQAP
jgi:aldose 1-epimerase